MCVLKIEKGGSSNHHKELGGLNDPESFGVKQ